MTWNAARRFHFSHFTAPVHAHACSETIPERKDAADALLMCFARLKKQRNHETH
jgi:hypothetical protein